jgi:hypothetical protein
MAEPKTKATKASAVAFLKAVKPEEKSKDSLVLLKLFEKVTKEKPVMWGTAIVGFGMYHYKSEKSAQEGDWPIVGFSPRKQNLTLYIRHGIEKDPAMKKLGKYKEGGGCLYINKLADVDVKILEKLIAVSFKRELTYGVRVK